MAIRASLIDHVHKLARPLMDTEIRGIRIDLEYAYSLGEELTTGIGTLHREMRAAAESDIYQMELESFIERKAEKKTERGKNNVQWEEFKFTSSKQLGALLYERLGLPGERKRKTGNWITNKDAISDIRHLHPIAERITRYNQLTTYYSTFIKGMLEKVEGDRVYPSFNVNGTKQGRISHSNPNMGNIPARDPEWSKIRGIFLPDEGHTIAAIDYGQIEVCVAAHETQDRNLLRIVNEGISQHDITSEELGVDRNSVAKPINFGMQYGATEFKIAKMLNCSLAEGKEVWDRYWEAYAGQKKVIDRCIRQVEAGETIYNLFGRGRHFKAGKRQPWSKDRRRGYSHLIQSTAADITNRAFYLVDTALRERGLGYGAWTVHDELILMVKEGYEQEVLDMASKIMVNVGVEVGLSVPLKVDGKVGLERWEK